MESGQPRMNTECTNIEALGAVLYLLRRGSRRERQARGEDK
jgi:hypothetical protein